MHVRNRLHSLFLFVLFVVRVWLVSAALRQAFRA
jgi:hypothetical protein